MEGRTRGELIPSGSKTARASSMPLKEEYFKNADGTLSFRFPGPYILAEKHVGARGTSRRRDIYSLSVYTSV